MGTNITVRYPFHPLYGRPLAESLVRNAPDRLLRPPE